MLPQDHPFFGCPNVRPPFPSFVLIFAPPKSVCDMSSSVYWTSFCPKGAKRKSNWVNIQFDLKKEKCQESITSNFFGQKESKICQIIKEFQDCSFSKTKLSNNYFSGKFLLRLAFVPNSTKNQILI